MTSGLTSEELKERIRYHQCPTPPLESSFRRSRSASALATYQLTSTGEDYDILKPRRLLWVLWRLQQYWVGCQKIRNTLRNGCQKTFVEIMGRLEALVLVVDCRSRAQQEHTFLQTSRCLLVSFYVYWYLIWLKQDQLTVALAKNL